jgi:ornithine cyclodeaminase
VNAVYALFDAHDGTPIALFDGEELTARRTAGVSVLAARHLARHDARHLVIAGAGRVGQALAEAYCALRGITEVSLWSRTAEHARHAAAKLARAGLPVTAVSDLERAARRADIVSCATLSTTPLVQGDWLPAGVHLDLVGAFSRTMRETDANAMARADLIVVDSRAGAMAEGGDVVQAIAEGAIDAGAVAATLADLACARHPGRTREAEITVFKSVGFALEDLAAAEAILDADAETAPKH